MKKIVIDTSAIIAVILGETERNKLIKLTENSLLIAPYSIHWEIGNAISAMFKRKRITIEEAEKAIELYEQIPIKFMDVDLTETINIAKRKDIYAYDAYLLICAKNNRAPLLTLDNKLAACATDQKIKILEI